MALLELSFDLRGLDADAAEALCFALGAQSVSYSDTRDDPILEPAPGEFRLWPAPRLQALYPAELANAELIARLAAGLSVDVQRIDARHIADRVWEREWLRDWKAQCFGKRLWVCPRHEPRAPDDAVVVRLDPGLAFGTGTHASTALCLQYLDEWPPRGAQVIDYGCGSGILGIAAACLGAAQVHAYDIDPQALTATRDNAAANQLGSRLRVHEDAGTLPAAVDLLLANILAGPLLELAPRFAARVRRGGQVVLAGLLQSQAQAVTEAYSSCFDMKVCGQREGWTALCGRRRHAGLA